MSNRSSVFAVCLIGLIVSIPLSHFKNKSLKGKWFSPFQETIIVPQFATDNLQPALPTISSVLVKAESVLKDAHQTDIVENEKSLLINLENDIWTVVSSPKEGQKGGVVQIRIDKKTGKILNISHGK